MTSWKNGEGDVLADFVASCKKFDIRPGIFYSVHNNWRQHVSAHIAHEPNPQQKFNEFAAAQIRELLGGTYGDLLGIWFDAGVWTDVMPDLLPLVRKLQPRSICHACTNGTQDPRNPAKGFGVRWCGNENGAMPLPSWGAADANAGYHKQVSGKGNPLGEVYMPAETDTVLRNHYWFWMNNTENKTKTTKQLVKTYFDSVGHNSNLILAIAPDQTGAVPSSDLEAYTKFGSAMQCLFSDPLCEGSSFASGTSTWEWNLTSPVSGHTQLIVSLQENLTNGQLINEWVLEWFLPDGWAQVATGEGIGYKRTFGGAGESAFKTPKQTEISQFRLRAVSQFGSADSAQLACCCVQTSVQLLC